jgi:DNA-binding SARP family transcriptional activator
MSNIRFFLFGKLRIEADSGINQKIEPRKAEELLVYLLLHRKQPQSREHLADVLWGELAPEQAKSYLRKALWQLQSALESFSGGQVLLIDGDWLQLNPNSDFWLDIEILEKAFKTTEGVRGREWEPKWAKGIEDAAELYQGELLDGWYQDWCLDERERLRHQYLAMLDKLIDYCESHQHYDHGLLFGEKILRHDCAREHTHRRVMRLYYLSGNRTAALRQYRKCVETLRKELDVEPAQATNELFEMIRLDHIDDMRSPGATPRQKIVEPGGESLNMVFAHLAEFQESLTKIQTQLSKDIRAIQKSLNRAL